jgi:hypothetical protein
MLGGGGLGDVNRCLAWAAFRLCTNSSKIAASSLSKRRVFDADVAAVEVDLTGFRGVRSGRLLLGLDCTGDRPDEADHLACDRDIHDICHLAARLERAISDDRTEAPVGKKCDDLPLDALQHVFGRAFAARAWGEPGGPWNSLRTQPISTAACVLSECGGPHGQSF